MGKFRFSGVLILAILFCSFPKINLAQFSNDAKWIPNNANCVVLISGERVFSSGLAKQENWADLNHGSFERGTSVIPPKVDRMIVASQFDLSFMQPIWTVTVMALSDTTIDLEKVATEKSRTIDQVAEHKAMVLPNDVFLIELSSGLYGAMAPADRQSLSRWVQASSKPSQLGSPYIAEAISFADKNSDITIAFDLQNAVGVDGARSRLKDFSSIKPDDIEIAAKAISRLRGMTLGITVREKIYGAIKIDFMPGTTGVDVLNQKAIIESLENNGIMIDDIRSWEYSANSGTLMLKGTLSEIGLRQINSLVAQPVQSIFRGIGMQAIDSSHSQDNSPEACTQRYLDKIDICFNEFQQFVQGQGKLSAKPYAKWFTSYADRIDMLSSENVDPVLLDFGGRVSDGFRDIAQILVTADSQTSSQNAQLTVYRDQYYSYNYYGYRRPGLSHQKKLIRTQNYEEAKVKATEIFNQLRSDLGNVRRGLETGRR